MEGIQNDWDGLYIKGFKSFADLVKKPKVIVVEDKNGKKKDETIFIDAPFVEYKEFYTYCLLVLNERRNQTISVNVSLLLDQSPIKYNAKKKQNREMLVESLMLLKEKKVIITANEYSKKHMLEDNIIELSINYEMLSGNDDTDTDWKGYEQIPFDAFLKAEKMQHLYIYFLVKRYDSNGFKCAYSNWAILLESSLSTAKRYIGEALDKRIIFANIGKYESGSRVKQQMNTYKTYSFKDTEKTTQTKIKESKKIRVDVPMGFDVSANTNWEEDNPF